MSFKDIPNNEILINKLKGIVKSKNIHHGYIIEGSTATDKFLVAKEFAKAIVCKAVEDDCCDACSTCIKVQNNNYIDLIVVEPASSKKSKVKSIKNDDIEELQKRLGKKAFEGERNIAIIKNADTMSQSAFNRFLKTLEEPPVGTVIMLLSENIKNLPQTIVSRCAHLRVNPWISAYNEECMSEARKLADMILEGALYFELKKVIDKKSKEDIDMFLDCLEETYRNDLIDEKIKKDYGIGAIKAVEKARIEIRKNFTVGYVIKSMALTIGGQ